MSAMLCPSCGGASFREVDRIAVHALVDGYRQSSVGIDVSNQVVDVDGSMALLECGTCTLKWYAPAPAGNADFYIELQQHAWYYQSEKTEYEFASRHVPAGGKVLEVGCGRGAFRRFLPEDSTYRGLEFNGGAVAMARADGLDVSVCSVEDEALAQPGAYDVVCHFQVLEHVANPRAFMSACAAALKPGGKLVVAVPAEDSFVGLAESCWLNMPPHHLTRWTDRALMHSYAAVGVDCETLWHEPVAEMHRHWHFTVMASVGFKSLLGGRSRLVGHGVLSQLGLRLGRLGSVGNWLYRRGLAASGCGSRGHTVCVVGRKR